MVIWVKMENKKLDSFGGVLVKSVSQSLQTSDKIERSSITSTVDSPIGSPTSISSTPTNENEKDNNSSLEIEKESQEKPGKQVLKLNVPNKGLVKVSLSSLNKGKIKIVKTVGKKGGEEFRGESYPLKLAVKTSSPSKATPMSAREFLTRYATATTTTTPTQHPLKIPGSQNSQEIARRESGGRSSEGDRSSGSKEEEESQNNNGEDNHNNSLSKSTRMSNKLMRSDLFKQVTRSSHFSSSQFVYSTSTGWRYLDANNDGEGEGGEEGGKGGEEEEEEEEIVKGTLRGILMRGGKRGEKGGGDNFYLGKFRYLTPTPQDFVALKNVSLVACGDCHYLFTTKVGGRV